ncbi:hypothetical protein CAOG_05827 [Capsaspora owczarzaki ATCC 30864]|nr:hypothetical protein CAOG_05827 [Capsaspora owczarzaki ATCC 30864]|eukprot:XP_004345417.1 hypothetical protein CAOG_05827 [Capsaspora owczarzaki ATCC 30864]
MGAAPPPEWVAQNTQRAIRQLTTLDTEVARQYWSRGVRDVLITLHDVVELPRDLVALNLGEPVSHQPFIKHLHRQRAREYVQNLRKMLETGTSQLQLRGIIRALQPQVTMATPPRDPPSTLNSEILANLWPSDVFEVVDVFQSIFTPRLRDDITYFAVALGRSSGSLDYCLSAPLPPSELISLKVQRECVEAAQAMLQQVDQELLERGYVDVLPGSLFQISATPSAMVEQGMTSGMPLRIGTLGVVV